MPNLKKIAQVDNLVKILQQNPNFSLVKFEQTTHKSLESLRQQLKSAGSQFKVIKNSLFEKAINKLSQVNKIFFEFRKKNFPLRENSALLILKNDWNKGLNSFYNFIQKEKTISFKAAILEQKIYNQEKILAIAQLPGKNQLIASIIGRMRGPLTSLTYNLKFNPQKLIYILTEKSKQGG